MPLFLLLLMLWFAFKLVSLNHWKQQSFRYPCQYGVVICFQISIFEPLETARPQIIPLPTELWFAFKLVSLNHWKQQALSDMRTRLVVICFQISIFEPLETAQQLFQWIKIMLWFAFKLVSLNHWKQLSRYRSCIPLLWFAFKLVSLNHWKQHCNPFEFVTECCDLLSN